MSDHARTGNYLATNRLYQQLPESLKKDKSVLLVRYRAASASRSEKFIVESIRDFRKYHPNDVCLDFLSIDYYYLKGQIEESVRCLGRLDTAVGGDPYLAMISASVYMETNDFQSAHKAMVKVIENESALVDTNLRKTAHAIHLSVCLNVEDHDGTLKMLRALRGEFQQQFGDLASVPEYAKFSKTPQYQEWVNGQPPG